jgi:bifunctional non-homologous end joining protein LigD
MSLDTYRRKRDFARTPEPSDESRSLPPPSARRRFVVQRHRARRLHYDFRLEMDGVLASWAVPKGPSLNPADRRMAVHVEDHPLSYFDFEGVIPKGEYGGGDVIVWDWGTYEPEETDDPGRAVKQGELKFRLWGEKLRGRFTLVRTRPRDTDEDNWLLIHKRDEQADPDWDIDDWPRSVKTGRTNDVVAAGADAVWNSHAPAAEAEIDLSAAREAPLPAFIEPMKATPVDRPFSDEDWFFELKLDGYRVEAVVDGREVRLWTRNRQNAAHYFPDLAGTQPTWIRAHDAIVDGEVVALDEEGRPQFSLLQDRAGMGRFGPRREDRGRRTHADEPPAPIVYYAFDLLYLDGRLLVDVPLEQRKRLLRSVLREHQMVRFASHVAADGEDFYRVISQRGLEGMVAKLRSSRYEPGRRSRSWLKIKIRREQEAVVVGYEPGRGSRSALGSLILAVNQDGELHYVGEVGSGLTERTIRQLKGKLDEHAVDAPPVANPPRIKGAVWSEPRFVVRVEFSEWTHDGYLRQAAFKGMELGRDPRTVVRERPTSTKPAVRAAESSAGPAAGRRPGVGPVAALPDRPSPRRGRPASPASHPPADLPQAATDEELAALDSLPSQGNWELGGRSIPLTNLDKVLFPEPGFTKRDLIHYYVSVAPVILPYLRDRALNLWRWPDGITGGHFWQKQLPAWAPDWIARWNYPEAGSRESHTYLVADQVATMGWLANHATIDVHPWTSRTDAYRNPTYALIDIDPGDRTTFAEVVALARLYRAALDHLLVRGFPKVTGKRGIQIWIPIRSGYSFDETRDWVEAVSRAVGGALPELVSWEWEKSARRGRARLDYTQNAVNKTLVAPYAVRPVANAAVSAPITWDELDDPELRPDRWNIRTILDRLAQRGDLFAPMLELEQELPPVS